ncbi:protein Mam3p [Trichomonascus vanleenenianus]|uniref:Mam3p n=1 Tax=Trichomonascus vanleenenianus TaxID=2268995 RepID=UPI003ECBA5D5
MIKKDPRRRTSRKSLKRWTNPDTGKEVLLSSCSDEDAVKPPPPPPQEGANTTRGNNKKSPVMAQLLLLLFTQLPLLHALPIFTRRGIEGGIGDGGSDLVEEPGTPQFWVNMGVSAFLVVLGGVFAGLTLGLMGQDEVYLQVMEQSGTLREQKAARQVLALLKHGKHWVLVTLLLSNVITNETLPIVLDRCLGGGWPAVVSSTVSIVIFGEIIPQSICVRYGLQVGSTFAPFVLMLMYLMYPVAYPVALLLDYLLGEDHGTIYRRAGLKTLVTLHKNMGVERLNEDEVTIISAVLDLKEKPVGTIMTPMEDVFVMSADRVLDEKTTEEILHTGFNRIPIHAPGEPKNFIGMLLVRILITYDPEDALPISSFPLATLPETAPDTSCLNILNYFQEGKSHMVIVSQRPGEATGALGVLTLEDVIEELIGEEIIDESDVYVDVHKAIRRTVPGPLSKQRLSLNSTTHIVASPRSSFGGEPVYALLHSNTESDLPKLKLNPLNKASNPRMTGNRNVHIKPARASHDSSLQNTVDVIDSREPHKRNNYYHHHHHEQEQDEPSEESATVSMSNGTAFKVHNCETGAIRDFLDSNSLGVSPKQILNNNSSQHLDIARTPSPEFHSYRAGGIIESVVNVKGVNKTVIEDISDNDSLDEDHSYRSISSPNKHYARRHQRVSDESRPSGETTPLLGPID